MNQEGIVRQDYIHALKKSDKGEYKPLIDLMGRLGAGNPSLCELIGNKFYRKYMAGEKGSATVKALLVNGANPNDRTTSGYRALQLAVKFGFDEIVKVLVAFGAEIDIKDRSGLTPFQVAVEQDNKALADFFLIKGAKQS
jgi:ankyrin repeat protein